MARLSKKLNYSKYILDLEYFLVILIMLEKSASTVIPPPFEPLFISPLGLLIRRYIGDTLCPSILPL